MSKNISPHVSIYKFPVTAISSIATRLSGLYLTGAFVGYGFVKLANKEEMFAKKYEQCSHIQKLFLHQMLILPTTYHTFGGIRHFIWDKYPQLLTNNKVVKSSYLLFGLTIATSTLIEKVLS